MKQTKSFDIKSKSDILKLEIEREEQFKQLEKYFTNIKAETEEDYFCTTVKNEQLSIDNTNQKNKQPYLSKFSNQFNESKIPLVTNKQIETKPLEIKLDSDAKKQLLDYYHQDSSVAALKNKFCANISPQTPKTKVLTTQKVLDDINQSSPIQNNRTPLNKRKREETSTTPLTPPYQKSAIERALTCKLTSNTNKPELNRGSNRGSINFDYENQENDNKIVQGSPIKTWNRNNSMNNKQCGKG